MSAKVLSNGGDAFVLKTSTLKEMAEKISRIFPECRTISMSASIRNIRAKSDDELVELSNLGINDLYVGVESGWDEILQRINKGHPVAEA